MTFHNGLAKMNPLKPRLTIVRVRSISSWGGYLGAIGMVLVGISVAQEPTLESSELKESSGVCVSPDDRMVWSHNDSGDEPRFFAFGRDGRFQAEIHLRRARAIDWEDMCSFSRDDRHYLAIGDVGDNQRRRTSVDIYVVRQPRADELGVATILNWDLTCRLTVNYPEGPINCEALAFDPLKNVFVLASKENFCCRLFEVDASRLDEDRKIEAVYLQTLLVPLVTGADISTDGKRMVFSTYGAGAMLYRDSEQRWALGNDPQQGIFELPIRRQGESICFADQNRHLLLTSEFAPTPLFTVIAPERSKVPN